MSREKGGDFLKENTTRLDIKKEYNEQKGRSHRMASPLVYYENKVLTILNLHAKLRKWQEDNGSKIRKRGEIIWHKYKG